MRTCRYCIKQGDWPAICMSTRDMEDKNDKFCRAQLIKIGGGEYVINQTEASSVVPSASAD